MVVNADLPSGLGNADLPTVVLPELVDRALDHHDLAARHRGARRSRSPARPTARPTPRAPRSTRRTRATTVRSAVGVATCTGPVPNGSLVDTSTLGVRSFTVNTTDLLGNAGSRTQHVHRRLRSRHRRARRAGRTKAPATRWASACRSTRASNQVVTVHYATADGVATSTSDYFSTSGDLTFNPGAPTQPDRARHAARRRQSTSRPRTSRSC